MLDYLIEKQPPRQKAAISESLDCFWQIKNMTTQNNPIY